MSFADWLKMSVLWGASVTSPLAAQEIDPLELLEWRSQVARPAYVTILAVGSLGADPIRRAYPNFTDNIDSFGVDMSWSE